MHANALTDLMQQHCQELTRFLMRRGTSLDDADEIIQETFIRYAECREAAVIVNPRAWLFKIAGNLAVDYQRRCAQRLPHETDAALLHGLPDDAPSLESVCHAQQRLDLLYQLLQELPENCRRAFYLNRVEGLTYLEIAAELGVSESMVGKYLVQAMRHCRDRLQET